MKTWLIIVIVIVVILVIGGILIVLRGLNGGEDNWMKNEKGVYVKHGNPYDTPVYVLEQQDALACANDLYLQASANSAKFDSQCLGSCGNYSVDIVHVPRDNAIDNLKQNQCSDFASGKTPYFIELEENGILVRVWEG